MMYRGKINESNYANFDCEQKRKQIFENFDKYRNAQTERE